MAARQHIMETAVTINELEPRRRENPIIEIVPLKGDIARMLGSETAAFYEKAGLCCDD